MRRLEKYVTILLWVFVIFDFLFWNRQARRQTYAREHNMSSQLVGSAQPLQCH